MEVTRTTRETAFTACWNERARLERRLAKQENGSQKHFEIQRRINDLDTAIDELRY